MVVLSSNTITGSVKGLSPGKKATVLLGNDAYLETRVVASGETYAFSDVPNDTYFLKIDVQGHVAPQTKTIVVNAPAPSALRSLFSTSAPAINFDTEPLASGSFTYLWEEDVSRAGHQETAYVNAPPTIEFLNEQIPVPDLAATEILRHDYHVLLSDDGIAWNQEYAYRLLETFKVIPQPIRDPYSAQTLKPSKWVLTGKTLPNDIVITESDQGNIAEISTKAFVYATPRLALVDSVRGVFFSKRLHHAVVRYVTRNGSDRAAVERILQDRFGCTTQVPDYEALTRPTTRESASSFQDFHAEELVEIINMFEEMPSGYHVISGLRYLLRRKDGMPHPLYHEAPAVAWARPQDFPDGSYIEFMATAFTVDPDHMHRLIVHEKAHFIWAYVFSSRLRRDWIALGGWYQSDQSPSGWLTTNTTEFVSAYAHAKNPDEDMAESLATFVLNPDLLRSRSLRKFEFLRDRVMHGSRYLSKIEENLTFEVLNLHPDYTYPGKINRVYVRADGGPEDDKQVTVEIGLHTDQKVFAGASRAYTRIFSEVGTFVDLYLFPTTAEGSALQGQFTLSRYAKSGFWKAAQIVVTDQVGNQRLEGVDDYGWRLFIDNPLEDLQAPRYVPGSLVLERDDAVVTERGVNYAVQRVRATWLVEDDGLLASNSSVYASLAVPGDYALESWGSAAPGVNPGTFVATANFYVTEFRPPGDYGVPYVMMFDLAGNRGEQGFSEAPYHEPLVSVSLQTANPDSLAPEVSLNDDPDQGLTRIRVFAQPTNPSAPNGETLVKIRYQARDDKSGIGQVSYRLLDPQGISHHQYHYHENFHSMFFFGDATAWSDYEISVVLPVGSPPGIWGLQELVLFDKAGNRRYYNFVETVRFDVVSN